MVQGEDLELTCKVSGYPFPSVRWLKDDQPFNTSTRIHLLEYEGSPTGKLTIYSLEFEDKGKYSCEATSSDPDFKNNTAVATMNIRVKGEFIALDKALFFSTKKVSIFFLFLDKNICCGYSLGVPR